MSIPETNANTTAKPCPRCGSAAGAGNGGSLCQCKKGKQATSTPGAAASSPTPCNAPIKTGGQTATEGDCGCGKK